MVSVIAVQQKLMQHADIRTTMNIYGDVVTDDMSHARCRKHFSLPPGPARPTRIEHEYHRKGAWVYLAAWDVRRVKIFGRCAHRNGIQPFDSLVAEVMEQEPYRSAPRVFWIMDNRSVHRGQRCAQRLQARWPSIVPLHTPKHVSWLNQVEIYFSVVQRKVLTPNNFSSLAQLEEALLAFQQRYEKSAAPFRWTFTREDLARLMTRLHTKALPRRLEPPAKYVTVIPNQSTRLSEA